MKIVKALAALLVITLAFGGGYLMRATKSTSSASKARTILYYTDAMNPAYKSDKPGIAPDGMALVPVYADEAASTGASEHAGHAILYYQDPQDPKYHADKPGLNPETGNTLEPVYADAPAVPPGAIKISTERQQLIGVKFATVELSGQARSIRAVGKVTFDETRVSHVHTRIDGWIERVFVDFTGDFVKQGQPMLTIYSPEMLATQQELLLAARARDLMRDNPLASAAEHGNSLFEAAKRRLELWQLNDDQIDQVLRTRQPIHSITLFAPASGFVTERKAFPNQRVTPDSDLYTITDLSRIWIVADVFESDITSIKVGDATYISFPNGNTPPLGARVTYIQPQVDPMTRTLKVRLDAPNPGLRMATGGRVLHHLKRCLPDHRNTVLLPGFQAAGTRGRALQNGASTVRIHGQDVPVRARVETIDGLSAHADRTELLRWMRGFRRPPARTYIVHGEPEGSQALAAAIRSELGWTAGVAEDGATVPLG